jgi:uncharacterized membrane protein YphA (DoxX/SURF4 family)
VLPIESLDRLAVEQRLEQRSMLLGSLLLLIQGGGAWSLDALQARTPSPMT